MDPIRKIINNVEVFYIPTTKFKTISCSFVFHNRFLRNEYNERHILSDLLVDNMKKYPTTEKRHKYLNNLYGLEAFGICTEMGYNIVNHFVVSYPNENFLPEPTNLSERAFRFLNEILTNPKMHDGKLTEKAVKEKIDEAKQMYYSMRQQKPVYAQYRFLQEYYRRQPDLFRIYPDFNNLANVTNVTMTNVYKKMLTEDFFQIFVTGDFDHDKMDEIIRNNLKITSGKKPKTSYSFILKKEMSDTVNEIEESGDVTQARIFLGYDTDIVEFTEMHPAMSVFDAMFGGFDQSRLFQKIREKMHLSYFVQSAYYAEEKMLMVAMGTNFQDSQKAISEVKDILKEMQEGNLPESLFELAKDYCIRSLESRNDSQTSLLIQNIKSYLRFKKPYSIDERLAAYKNVTMADVLEVANRLKLNTVYNYTKSEVK